MFRCLCFSVSVASLIVAATMAMPRYAPAASGAAAAGEPVALEPGGLEQRWSVPGRTGQQVRLTAGQTLEVSVHVEQPSRLPDNARLTCAWKLVTADDPALAPRGPDGAAAGAHAAAARAPDAFGIYTAPTANWSKLLHALDADLFLVYRAPVAGVYELTVSPEEGSVKLFNGPRWRESGTAPQSRPVPDSVNWPAGAAVDVTVRLRPMIVAGEEAARMSIEAEPNDTPEQAQLLALPAGDDEISMHVIGSSDDIEYFDNGQVGASGDDWFRIDYRGTEKRLLTACLSIPDQQVAAQIRAYRIDPVAGPAGLRPAVPGQLLPVIVYDEGRNENERSHQQSEQHRIAINRWVEPGQSYFLRVEANAPGYELEVRVVRPAPFEDPRRAVRQALYDHIGQVDSWLTNRPRGASVERRIRDSGNLLGTNCMSCHTQSGVWGPAIPFTLGYAPQNRMLWRHLINTCYQSLRPTNELKDAANNTSLAPYDLGDGPAGTRVAGHAVVELERYMTPRRLQSMQARRVANFVLQSGDPGGVNAAGPGANVGQAVVFNYTGEILWTAWKASGEARFFHALEDRARRMLDLEPKFNDDLNHRVEFLCRYFPPAAEYQAAVERYAATEQTDDKKRSEVVAAATALSARIAAQVAADVARIRAIQLEGGGWSFDPGTAAAGAKGDAAGLQGWTVTDLAADPSPTATALIALHAAGAGVDDPAIKRGVAALLKMQHPTGYWKIKSETGFVATSYSMHALSRLFPATPQPPVTPADIPAGAGLPAELRRVRDLANAQDPKFTAQLVEAARHPSPLVRFVACVGLGYIYPEAGVKPLVENLGHPSKMVREAAHWGLRETLIDDRGWDDLFAAADSRDDATREAAVRALVMKVDGVLPQSAVSWDRLTGLLARALNDDPHPGVRAWATRAAWQWWIWNPPVREAINKAWVKLLLRDEPQTIVENAIRYQSHALFIANGHAANATSTHQYRELATLFADLQAALNEAQAHDAPRARRLMDRLVAIAATFYSQRGGDGGPGQLGYATPGAADLFGDVVLSRLGEIEQQPAGDQRELLVRLTLESAANIKHRKLQERLVEYSLNGPEELRSIAAASISDPRQASLVAVPEQLEPMYKQLLRGANDPARRSTLSDPVLKMYRVQWIIPELREQRDKILPYLVPEMDTYREPAEVAAMTDVPARQAAERAADAAWYLAEGLGKAISENKDLHIDALLEAFPEQAQNGAEARFWLRTVPWVLSFQRKLPEVQKNDKTVLPLDAYEAVRTRALRLFLTQLKQPADRRNREEAVKLANETSLRRNPEVLSALGELVKFEPDKATVERVKNVLSQTQGNFDRDLAAAVRKEPVQRFPDGALPADFIEDVTYFRDYVQPEMSRVLRGDERSCLICHGEPGRVPSMELHRPDEVGYLPVDKLLANYRILQDRVNVRDVEKSKLLRKPLNVQTGEEDGHQGGRRYQPTDEGYQILRKWALNQTQIQAKYKAVTTP